MSGLSRLIVRGHPNIRLEKIPGLSWVADVKGGSISGNNNVWLRDFLPHDIPNARILLYGYDTKLLHSGSRQTIEDISVSLLNVLSAFRAEEDSKRRPIIFIGHSFGGLLIKECLLQAHREKSPGSHHAVYEACCGLLLFGVPNHELDNNNNLEPSNYLKRISRDFSEQWGNHCPVVSFYETRLSPTVQLLPDGTLEKSGQSISMVTTHSATAVIGNTGGGSV
ncbi:Protein SERAC1 [Colletotrichum orbiculare MAFF 240422]|uniref:Protein SERAC1 n=1 Tax=Colletotrichum orbiculare (strain 104-T / ATCC 96160 / CBS 514.97 / LARS 414 / MAFF 240422) TaxID=1213857 RepID=A0A484FB18_COLOR|nr:Protein SERAC1 [Colletotrichum orbiculare MAFF 240422]